ncbi:hypothetical protein ACT691_09805 [Vibrio metschnikovii]
MIGRFDTAYGIQVLPFPASLIVMITFCFTSCWVLPHQASALSSQRTERHEALLNWPLRRSITSIAFQRGLNKGLSISITGIVGAVLVCAPSSVVMV